MHNNTSKHVKKKRKEKENVSYNWNIEQPNIRIWMYTWKQLLYLSLMKIVLHLWVREERTQLYSICTVNAITILCLKIHVQLSSQRNNNKHYQIEIVCFLQKNIKKYAGKNWTWCRIYRIFLITFFFFTSFHKVHKPFLFKR